MSERSQQVSSLYQPVAVSSANSHARFGRRQLGRISLLLLACCLIGLLTACASVPSSSGAVIKESTVTPNAQATASAQPVLIQLRATPTGTIAAASLEISVEIRVTNQTGQTISLAHYAAVMCLPPPPVVFSLLNGDKKTVWQETHSDSCPLGPVYDVVTIPAGGSKQWTTMLDIRYDLAHGVITLSPGTYTLAATGLLWHEGAISASGDTSSAHGYAEGQTMLTLQ